MPLEFIGKIIVAFVLMYLTLRNGTKFYVFIYRSSRFAEAHNRVDLLETSLRFIQVNFPQVSQEEEFLDLPKEHLVRFLSSDLIHIDTEFQVIIIPLLAR